MLEGGTDRIWYMSPSVVHSPVFRFSPCLWQFIWNQYGYPAGEMPATTLTVHVNGLQQIQVLTCTPEEH